MVFGITTGIGASSYFGGLFSYLKSHDFEVNFIAKDEAGAREFAEGEGATFIPIDLKREPSPLSDIGGLLRMVQILRIVKPEICVWGTPKAGLLGVLASKILRVKSVYVVHGLRYAGCAGWRRSVYRAVEAISCRTADHVVTVGSEIGQQLVDDKVLRRVPQLVGNGSANGIEDAHPVPRVQALQELGLAPGTLVVGFVGRVTSDKGIPELLLAWRIVLAEFEGSVRLAVAGLREPDSYIAPLSKLIDSAEKVSWMGHLRDLRPLYSCLDVLVLPSKREGLPAVLLEAGVYQRASVVGTNPGVGEAVLNGLTGLKVDPSDIRSLADSILVLLRDEKLRTDMGIAAREHVLGTYSRNSVHQAWSDYLQSLAR